MRSQAPPFGGLVVGEAYRVDEDKVAAVAFDPANRATWGKGGKAPLLIDPCASGPTHSLIFAGAVVECGWWRMDTATRRIGRQRRSRVPYGTNHIDETA
jgi:hypothetical protein